MVKCTEHRSSKIETNNLYIRFSTMVTIGDLDRSSFTEVGENKSTFQRVRE